MGTPAHAFPRRGFVGTPISETMIRLAGLRVLYGSSRPSMASISKFVAANSSASSAPTAPANRPPFASLSASVARAPAPSPSPGYDVVRDWAEIKPLFGYVPDRENHFEEFTGRRNLEFFGQLYGVPRPPRPGRARDGRTRRGRRSARSRLLARHAKKLLLARALLHEPPILYLDEPTANLDIHSAEVVHRILRERVKFGATIIMTTHDMDEVEKICDRVGIVCRGKLVALDSPLALKQEHTERKVDVIRTDGERLVFDLDREPERRQLAALVESGTAASVRTREFDFHATFLKLTGQAFD